MENNRKINASKIISVVNNFKVHYPINKKHIKIKQIISGLLHKTYEVDDIVHNNKYIVQRLKPIFDLKAVNTNLKLFEKIQSEKEMILPNYWSKVNYLNVANSSDKIFVDKNKENWRVMEYVDGRIFNDISQLPKKERLSLAYSFGEGLSIFGCLLQSATIKVWKKPLPNFHNLLYHYKYLYQILTGKSVSLSLSKDKSIKVKLQKPFFEKYGQRINNLIGKIEERKEAMVALKDGVNCITHGDPKLNNAVFSKNGEGKWECISFIDLDTLQSGEKLDDVGDALRSIGSLGNENPKDLSSVYIDKLIVESVIKGYLNKQKEFGAQPIDKKLIYNSYAKFLYMLSLRFLADSLVENKYFSIGKNQRQDLNLYRAEVQMRTLEILENSVMNSL